MLFEGVDAFVIPACEHLLRRALDIGHVNGDILCLANPIETANPLFKQFGIERQVEQHEVMRELKVAAFTTNFGANKNLGAVFFGKPRGVSVALDERKLFVKECAFDFDSSMESAFDHFHFFQIAAEE